MEPNHKQWFLDHKELHKALKKPIQLEAVKTLFFRQHAPLHARKVSGTAGWNLEEEVWQGLTETQFRCVPERMEHSVAWAYWHLARIEDVTMNLLVAGTDQVYNQEDWKIRLQAPFDHTGNLITPADLKMLNEHLNWFAIRDYRSAVGKRTREIVSALTVADLQRRTPPERLQRGLYEGAIAPYAAGLIEYWGGLTVTGLLLMPPTRHNFSHLNECLKIKQKVMKSPERK